MVKEITNVQEFAEAIGKDTTGLVIIDFYTTWCGPCKAIAPYYEKLSEKYANVAFFKLNSELEGNVSISEVCEIKCLPTFCLFKFGKYVDRVEGADLTKLENLVITNLN
ncbi:thioredoxin-like protein [Megavirus courdo11]|uniref:Thioredoxin-like protein n=4 Tax=Megavirus TaxID=3044761 RepID=L7Y6J0_9VIRU|nr:thioredoxin-like protein [Megavirus courdo7]AFX92754.1 thioredoxin-like protein [Megavirus courdo11]AGD92613.1 thioredoxin-like protein [Megavirus lba]AUV58617.1 thioredoxin [Bandra megavirus]AVL93984.1 thioredoxin-like protein [Megavirus vitis]